MEGNKYTPTEKMTLRNIYIGLFFCAYLMGIFLGIIYSLVGWVWFEYNYLIPVITTVALILTPLLTVKLAKLMKFEPKKEQDNGMGR